MNNLLNKSLKECDKDLFNLIEFEKRDMKKWKENERFYCCL
jgi:hypothetical protein